MQWTITDLEVFNTGVGQDMLLKTDQNSTHLKYFNACISYDGDYDLSNKNSRKSH